MLRDGIGFWVLHLGAWSVPLVAILAAPALSVAGGVIALAMVPVLLRAPGRPAPAAA